MDVVSIVTILLLVFVEISVLVYLYRNYITSWNADKWEEKARDGNWLVELLDPVILEVAEMVSATIIQNVKQEYMQAQGTMTRIAKSGDVDEASMGLTIAEGILKQMGWKNPNVLLVSKLAQTLGGLISKDSEPKKGSTLPMGSALFGTE